MSLFLAALCHDLDHRGFNNAFLTSTAHPLASLYTTSILENHHTSQMVALLQLDSLNVFSLLSAEDYKLVQWVEARDLASVFKFMGGIGRYMHSL